MDYTIKRKPKPPVVSDVESVTLTLTPAEFLALDALRYHYLGGVNPLSEPFDNIRRELFGPMSPGGFTSGKNVVWARVRDFVGE